MKTKSIIRDSNEGDKRWFFGGGVHHWKLSSDETSGMLGLFEDTMERGKVTPLHVHPDSDEVVYVLEGEVLVHANGVERRVGVGGVVINPRGAPHAFTVTSERARLLCMLTPGERPQSFYQQASVPGESGPVDFQKIGEAAQQTGATVIMGPPPFKR